MLVLAGVWSLFEGQTKWLACLFWRGHFSFQAGYINKTLQNLVDKFFIPPPTEWPIGVIVDGPQHML